MRLQAAAMCYPSSGAPPRASEPVVPADRDPKEMRPHVLRHYSGAYPG
jgi:hypothetical protein